MVTGIGVDPAPQDDELDEQRSIVAVFYVSARWRRKAGSS
jgi:hypothetical protein